MNGVHDMGGMHGFGPVEPERDEPVFHAEWEARIFALRLATGAWGKWNIDASRFSVESIPPAEYLRASYYENRVTSFIELLVASGLVTREEIERGLPNSSAVRSTPRLTADAVPARLARGSPARRDVRARPRFAPGDRVRARNLHPSGHTRLPRYTRGKVGRIVRDHGVFVFPDSNARFAGEKPQHLYSVRFTARELWGKQARRRDVLYVDLWEDYLERL